MGEKNVFLNISGTQVDSGASSNVELFTDGHIIPWGLGWKLSYQETDISGMEGSITVIHALRDKVSMHRKGEFGARMEFRQGFPFVGSYQTPYGELRLRLYPSVVRCDLDTEGHGEIELKYQLEIGEENIGVNHLQIKVMQDRKTVQ